MSNLPAMYPFPHGELVVILRARRVIDPYSGELEDLDWTDPIEIPYPGCAVEPRSTDEPFDIERWRAPVITGIRVFGPPDMDVTADDRALVRGEVWEVDGDPARPVNPWTGWRPGTVVQLRKVRG